LFDVYDYGRPHVVMGRPLCFTHDIYYLPFITHYLTLLFFSRSNLRGRQNASRGTFARMSECGIITNFISYIRRGPYVSRIITVENLLVDFGNFKHYNFGIAQDIANVKQRSETTYTLRNICARYSGPQRSGCWDRYNSATSWKSQNSQNRDILATTSSFVKRFALCYRSVVCLWRSCAVAKRLDGSRWNLACR